MKTKLNLLLLVLAVMVVRCTDEHVEPTTLTEELVTSANLYEDQFFTIGITTLKNHPEEPLPEQVEFYLQGNGGRISINWGDGTIEKLTIGSSIVTLNHQYKAAKNYTINMSGDIKTITSFRMNYLGTRINKIHFGGLVNLKEAEMGLLPYTMDVINLSRNRALETVRVVGLQSMDDVLLPSNNKLVNVDISGENEMTTAAVDRVIARVHDSVINNPRKGSFVLGSLWGETNEMIGPPSSYSINKLKKLRDVYGWTIYPEIP